MLKGILNFSEYNPTSTNRDKIFWIQSAILLSLIIIGLSSIILTVILVIINLIILLLLETFLKETDKFTRIIYMSNDPPPLPEGIEAPPDINDPIKRFGCNSDYKTPRERASEYQMNRMLYRPKINQNIRKKFFGTIGRFNEF